MNNIVILCNRYNVRGIVLLIIYYLWLMCSFHISLFTTSNANEVCYWRGGNIISKSDRLCNFATFYTQDYLMDFNLVTSKEMRLIFFMDAIEHICRLARLLRAERGNGLLVGVGGMGKQSLTKLGAHLNGYRYLSYTNLYVLSFFILKINFALKLLSTPNLYFLLL